MLLQNLGHIEEHQIRVLCVRTAVGRQRECIVAFASDVNLRTLQESPTSIRVTQFTSEALNLSTTSLLLEVVRQILVGITLVVVLLRTQPQIGQVTSAVANLVGDNLQLIIA